MISKLIWHVKLAKLLPDHTAHYTGPVSLITHIAVKETQQKRDDILFWKYSQSLLWRLYSFTRVRDPVERQNESGVHTGSKTMNTTTHLKQYEGLFGSNT